MRRGQRVALVSVLVGLMCAVPAAAEESAADSRSITPFRHHVIFLLDSSGSMFGRQYGLDRYRRVLNEHLPRLLSDKQVNGFSDRLYDPAKDLSTTFTFGLTFERPFFAPELPNGFIREVWFQEPGRTFAQLADVAPTTGLFFTAYNSALSQAVRKMQWRLSNGGALPHAFERTFLVMISDGEANTGTDSTDEVKNIHGRIGNTQPRHRLDSDRFALQDFYWRFVSFYSLKVAAPEHKASLDFLEAGEPGAARKFRVFIRELVPSGRIGLNDLLVIRPNQVTELQRVGSARYAGTVQLRPAASHERESAAYRFLDLAVLLPGETKWRNEPLPLRGQPFAWRVNLARDELLRSTLQFRTRFTRHDPIYGQAIVTFDELVRFKGEATKRILWYVPIPDWLMGLLPGRTQDEIATLGNVLSVIAAGTGLLMLLLPRPRTAVELAARDDSVPISVDLNANANEPGAGGTRGTQVLLRTLRFRNEGKHRVPLLGWTLPKLAERKFRASVAVEGHFPATLTTTPPVVGIGSTIAPSEEADKLTDGSERVLLLNTSGLVDYDGPVDQAVQCTLTVKASQISRPLRLFERRRDLPVLSAPFALRLIPEEPTVTGRFVAGGPDIHTGSVASRPLPDIAGVGPWVTVPHTRGRRQDHPEAPPELWLAIRNDARHLCARGAHARISVVMYPVSDHAHAIPLSLPPEEQVQWNIKSAVGGDDRVRWVPIHLDYDSDKLPPPGDLGEDYVISATIEAEGQEWGTRVVRCGVRLGPDERQAALRLRVDDLTEADRPGNQQAWKSFEPTPSEPVLNVTRDRPLLWSIGTVKPVQPLIAFEIDNVARTGSGAIELHLSTVKVQAAPKPDSTFEPKYVKRSSRQQVVQVRQDGKPTTNRKWTVANEAPSSKRPQVVSVMFVPDQIADLGEVTQCEYTCELDFELYVRASADVEPERRQFSVRVDFIVQLDVGDYVLAVDFGTSAVVAAFAHNDAAIAARTRLPNFSDATLNLQEQYRQLLGDWARSTELDLQNEAKDGQVDLRGEPQTAFLPSRMSLRHEQRAGSAEFVHLPASFRRLSREWDRAVFYLKGLILRGDEFLPNQQLGKLGQPYSWTDRTDRGQSGAPLVDDIIESAYRALVDEYVRPRLRKDELEAHLAKLIVAHPNSFTVAHTHKLRKILQRTFSKFLEINFISESNAVVLYCERNEERFFARKPKVGEHRHLLVYDIGAGTLDVTLSRIDWLPASANSAPRKEITVLFKIGLPVAGNSLDEALARMIDAKLRAVETPLRDAGLVFNYHNPIVEPEVFDAFPYAVRMLELKQAVHRLKLELAATKSAQDVVAIDLDATGDNVHGLVTVGAGPSVTPEQVLPKLGVSLKGVGFSAKLRLSFTRAEIYGHPEVGRWLTDVTDEIMADLGAALTQLNTPVQIDTLVLSGRTALFAPLRPRLMKAIETHLHIKESAISCPELSPTEKKEAVALGALYSALFEGRELRTIDRNIWARYGVVYNSVLGSRFQEFFSFATEPDKDLGDRNIGSDRQRTLLFDRTHHLDRASGGMEVVATFSSTPDADLRDPAARKRKFVPLGQISAGYLPKAGPVTIRIRNEEDDKITVILNPGPVETPILLHATPPEADRLTLQEWPYNKLPRLADPTS